MTPDPSIDIEWLRDAVARLFAGNRLVRRDESGRESTYHAPSLGGFPGSYPHQWFWDSCAHAIALRHVDIRLARQELLSLLAAQREDGLIPLLIFNPARMNAVARIVSHIQAARRSPYLQPPVLAQAALAVQEKEPSKEFLSAALPGIKRYHRYLSAARDRSADGLLEIVHSYESGKDRSREYDQVYGHRIGLGIRTLPMVMLIIRHRLLGWDLERMFDSNLFRVKDLLFNCVYARDLRALQQLCILAGEVAEAADFAALNRKTEAAILGKMHSAETGLFYSLDSRRGADVQIKVSTLSTFLPLLLDSIDEARVERLVNEHLANTSEYWTRFPVPAEPLGSPEAKWARTGLWRGLQTWIFTNWFICQGLMKQAGRFAAGHDRYAEMAKEITLSSYEAVRRSGFREYYHSQTGEGQRALDFGMSALVLDMALTLPP
ncbi:MAG: hypothetical protein Q7T05_08370 [Dehalococcoidia bacterium]|nr:hypothetical protein [Dehalococcoidia bacterium]